MRNHPLGIYEKALAKDLSWPERLVLAKSCGFDFVEMSVDETDEHRCRSRWSPYHQKKKDKCFFKYRTLTVLSGADTQSRTGDLTLTKGALYQLSHISTLNLMPGSSLLSHGETPHYHRRYGVSLLSSAWGQVGPPR